ncbi:hypothetical protein Cgig2_033559 [Carnegiea gigantea]|uniref:Retrovirus-related Pol polyprotein from transposon TNT 1-94-like beta-barrel domain-containing protein n=1 Tax=Carnegiea gigantea TaxID=171969 RepID=A0A9Q1KNP0_9CARY|nr:hypothetical protein Cgig2_033559 [Carnegiea gigantea]
MRGKAKLEDEDDSDANVIDKGDVFLAESAQESVDDSGQNFWVLDSAASTHIYKDKSSFDTLHSYGIGSVRLKLQNDVVRTFHNVKHAPSAGVNLILLGELTSHGLCWSNQLILQGEKDKKNTYRLMGCLVLETTDDCKWFEKRRQVRFSNVVEMFGNESKALVVPPNSQEGGDLLGVPSNLVDTNNNNNFI